MAYRPIVLGTMVGYGSAGRFAFPQVGKLLPCFSRLQLRDFEAKIVSEGAGMLVS